MIHSLGEQTNKPHSDLNSLFHLRMNCIMSQAISVTLILREPEINRL